MDVADKGKLDGGRLRQIKIEFSQDVAGRRRRVGNVGKDLNVECHQVTSEKPKYGHMQLNQMTRGYVTIDTEASIKACALAFSQY